MPIIQPVIKIELDPSRPVQELCGVISAVSAYHPGQEDAVLKGVRDAIERRLEQLKGDVPDGKQIREPNRDE